MSLWISSRRVATRCRRPSRGMGTLRRSSLRTDMNWFFSRSFGPISRRSGTPFSSHSLNFQPGDTSSLRSAFTRKAPFSSSAARLATSAMRCFSSSLFQIGTMTTCSGARRGGKLTPLSSPWAITRAPIRRVLTPHDVDQTCSQVPSLVWYLTSNAFAKFCPRLWDVPPCSAFLSCISASMQ